MTHTKPDSNDAWCEGKIKAAEDSDWMQRVHACESYCFAHGFNHYQGEIIQDWLRKTLKEAIEFGRTRNDDGELWSTDEERGHQLGVLDGRQAERERIMAALPTKKFSDPILGVPQAADYAWNACIDKIRAIISQGDV